MRRRLPWVSILAIAVVLLVPAVAGADDGSAFTEYQSRGWVWMFLASFGFGFLTSLTPCVYPMIPITLAIFGARGENVSRRRAVGLATAYVGGMGLTYSSLGVCFALLGNVSDFGTQLASPYFVVPLVIVFCALAASMFGAFDLNLPASWQARLNQVGGKGFGGAFAMGLVGGLIAAPCTGPFLFGLLSFVSTTGSVVGGGALLFTYAIGMGVLFWLLAAFALALPKSGRWMESVKSAGGVGLLFAAVYFLRPLFPWLRHFAPPALWFLAASVAIGVVGIALGAIHLSFHAAWRERLRKGAGVVLLLAGAVGVWTWKMTPKRHLPWVYDEATAFARAKAEHKGVMIDFSASFCNPCEELELTFGDDDVYDTITASFVPLKFDVSNNTDEDFDRRARFKAGTLPSVVFQAADGTELARVSKFIEVDPMLDIVRPAAKKAQSMAAGQKTSSR